MSLGRNVVVAPGGPVPAEWAGADRVVVDRPVLDDPGVEHGTVEVLVRACLVIPVIPELICGRGDRRFAIGHDVNRAPYRVAVDIDEARPVEVPVT